MGSGQLISDNLEQLTVQSVGKRVTCDSMFSMQPSSSPIDDVKCVDGSNFVPFVRDIVNVGMTFHLYLLFVIVVWLVLVLLVRLW